MARLKTENCIICGQQATNWHGHVLAKQRMALGNYISIKVIAGFCKKHIERMESDENGCYGNYEDETMGKCVPMF